MVLTHLIPPVPGGILVGPFLDGARRRFEGPLSIGEDGDLIKLAGWRPHDDKEERALDLG